MYSRITGYYRPVQNWNVGKTQEYKERQEYDIESSVLRHQGPLPAESPKPAGETQAAPATAEKRAILFAAPSCPNCRIAYSYLDKAGFAYEKIMAEEDPDLALSFGVRQAPTLVLTGADGFRKYAGAPAIKEFLAG